MRNDDAIPCPFCGEENCLLIDATVGSQRFITDCEVCCRPFEVAIQCEHGELISRQAGLAFPIRDGLPIMLVDEARSLDGGGA